MYMAIACGERRKAEDRFVNFSSNAPNIASSEIRPAASAAFLAPAMGVEEAIVADLSTIPEVLGVRIEHENGDTLVWVFVNQPTKDLRYRIYGKQASLIEAFPAVDLNFNLIRTE